MKKLLSIMFVTMMTLSLSAHTITKQSTCWSGGAFVFKGTQFDGSQKVKLSVSAGYYFIVNNVHVTNYTFTTGAGANLSQSFTATVYKESPYTGTWWATLTCTYGGGQGTSNNAVNSPLVSGDDICAGGGGGLPVTLVNFAAKKNSDYSTSVSWTTTMEANNNYFQLEGSNDGKNFHTEVLIFSLAADGNSGGPLNYSYKVAATTQSKLILAGFGMGGTLLLLAFLIGTMKRKKAFWLAPLMVLVFAGSLVSCQKHVDVPADKASVKWKYVRLKQVDKDGTIVIASSTLIVNN